MSLLDAITPTLLTYQEAPNIDRALESLRWAADVVVVDSGSIDDTVARATAHSNVRVFYRAFDDYAGQWGFALAATAIRTPFVLALDADMAMTEGLRRELEALPAEVTWNGALLPFDYRIRGRSLGRSMLAPQLRLVRREVARIGQRGHAHRIECPAPIVSLKGQLVHDDRKGLEVFLTSQAKYSMQEWQRLCQPRAQRWIDRLRRHGGLLGSAGICAYAAVRTGLWSSNAARRRYWIERALFELLLAYRREDDALGTEEPAASFIQR